MSAVGSGVHGAALVPQQNNSLGAKIGNFIRSAPSPADAVSGAFKLIGMGTEAGIVLGLLIFAEMAKGVGGQSGTSTTEAPPECSLGGGFTAHAEGAACNGIRAGLAIAGIFAVGTLIVVLLCLYNGMKGCPSAHTPSDV